MSKVNKAVLAAVMLLGMRLNSFAHSDIDGPEAAGPNVGAAFADAAGLAAALGGPVSETSAALSRTSRGGGMESQTLPTVAATPNEVLFPSPESAPQVESWKDRLRLTQEQWRKIAQVATYARLHSPSGLLIVGHLRTHALQVQFPPASTLENQGPSWEGDLQDHGFPLTEIRLIPNLHGSDFYLRPCRMDGHHAPTHIKYVFLVKGDGTVDPEAEYYHNKYHTLALSASGTFYHMDKLPLSNAAAMASLQAELEFWMKYELPEPVAVPGTNEAGHFTLPPAIDPKWREGLQLTAAERDRLLKVTQYTIGYSHSDNQIGDPGNGFRMQVAFDRSGKYYIQSMELMRNGYAFRILADGQVDSGVIRYSYNYASLSWENHGEVIRLTNQELRERFQDALSRWLSFSDTLIERNNGKSL